MNTKENQEHCKYIAENFEKYTSDDYIRCNDCCELIPQDSDKCPDCGAEIDSDDKHYLDAIDYLEDCLDVQAIRNGLDRDAEIIGARILVAWGGPNIWVDTLRGVVTLDWWTDHSECYIDRAACDEFNDQLNSYWG